MLFVCLQIEAIYMQILFEEFASIILFSIQFNSIQVILISINCCLAIKLTTITY